VDRVYTTAKISAGSWMESVPVAEDYFPEGLKGAKHAKCDILKKLKFNP